MNRKRTGRKAHLQKPRLVMARNASNHHVYQVKIIPAQSGPEVVLWFLNYPDRATLAQWCKWVVIGVYDELYRSIIDHSEWPDALPEDVSGFVDSVENGGNTIGEIQLTRYPVINNPGPIELFESGGEGRRFGRDTP